MSLATEVARTFVQASHVVNSAVLDTVQLTTGSFGEGILFVPQDQEEDSTVIIPANVTNVITASDQDYNLQFSAAECFVGRIIQGMNKGAGVVTFVEAVPNTITFVDNGGFAVTSATASLQAFRNANAMFVCTQANGTTATLQTLDGTYGGNPVLSIGASDTLAYIGISTTSIVSSASAAATVVIIPFYLNNNGLPGRRLQVTQQGGTTGSVSFAAAPNTSVTFKSLATGLAFAPLITPGSTMNFIVESGTPTSVVLQQI
jgi:hypothetical protein